MGIRCKSETVPAAVSSNKTCYSRSLSPPEAEEGRPTGSSKSEDLPQASRSHCLRDKGREQRKVR